MSAFKTVKFTSSAGKFEPLNLTTAFAEFFKFGSLNLKLIDANSALQKVKFDA
ncbi:hypothetical protein [uncultured Campylobacter sp.]|uniref:hypothetical protein n=1 Tax=uncultured Campylobacter sp. TaxID=218934 RepID=UPI0026027FCB|nr:hypothetical protein [uncultured Campylobacter sp.]